MKLAEALQERADLCKKIDQLRYRLESNATVQEGEQTAEDPQELLSELDTAISRSLFQLIIFIQSISFLFQPGVYELLGNHDFTVFGCYRICIAKVEAFSRSVKNFPAFYYQVHTLH